MTTLILPSDVIHVWQCDLNLSADQLAKLWQLLSTTEQQRALRFKFDKHRNRFIAAKGSLRLLLGNYLQQDPATIEFSYGAHGKPVLSNQQLNYPLFFNSSDSHELALFALSQHELIGVDIEYMRDKISAVEIAERFFSTEEYKYLKKLNPADQQAAFFKIWTLKEAFIKALGLGLSFPLKDFDINIHEAVYLAAIRGHNLQAKDWYLFSFPVTADFMGALAIKTKINTVEFFNFNVDLNAPR